MAPSFPSSTILQSIGKASDSKAISWEIPGGIRTPTSRRSGKKKGLCHSRFLWIANAGAARTFLHQFGPPGRAVPRVFHFEGECLTASFPDYRATGNGCEKYPWGKFLGRPKQYPRNYTNRPSMEDFLGKARAKELLRNLTYCKGRYNEPFCLRVCLRWIG